MNCPLFNDFTRECLAKIEVFPVHITSEMMRFCSSDRHQDCPFYQILNSKEAVCKNILKCPAFKNFSSEQFDEFVSISNQYCTSPNHATCQRFILKERGEAVPLALHPNGSTVKEWEAVA